MNTSDETKPYKTRYIAAALLHRGDEYLFIRQSKDGGAYQDNLHIPGGGIEPGETPIEAVRREVEEEVGLTINDFSQVDFSWDSLNYKGEPTVLVFLRFTGEIPHGQNPTPSSDAKELVWLRKSELLSGSHNPATLSLLRVLNLIG